MRAILALALLTLPAFAETPLPVVDPSVDCTRQYPANNAGFNMCMSYSQAAYDEIKDAWEILPEAAKSKCVATWPKNQPHYYVGLRACLIREDRKAQIDAIKSERGSFRY